MSARHVSGVAADELARSLPPRTPRQSEPRNGCGVRFRRRRCARSIGGARRRRAARRGAETAQPEAPTLAGRAGPCRPGRWGVAIDAGSVRRRPGWTTLCGAARGRRISTVSPDMVAAAGNLAIGLLLVYGVACWVDWWWRQLRHAPSVSIASLLQPGERVVLTQDYFPLWAPPYRYTRVLTTERVLTFRQRLSKWSYWNWPAVRPQSHADFRLADVVDVRVLPLGRNACEIQVRLRGSTLSQSGVKLPNRDKAETWARAIRDSMGRSSTAG